MVLQSEKGLSSARLRKALADSLKGKDPKHVLLLPPDYTRLYSGAGIIVQEYWKLLSGRCEVDIMPALGTHEKMTEKEW
ncbi:MAG: D-mannonate epimerase, partial [Clostridia bacterium]|nr:D-mannonate epimerase [Clostridia bacterium]